MIPSLIEFGLLASGLAAALALFVSVKQEVRVQGRKNRARVDEILQHVLDSQRPLLAAGASEAPAPEPGLALPQGVPRSGMNLNKRIQAGRLLRRGEDVSHVAAALGVQRREIELLMRVQKLSAQRAAGAGG